jgi:ornithine carbamoyltransferase
MKDFLELYDFSTDELNEMLVLSTDLKKLYKSGKRDLCLAGKTLAMLFEKPSLRTRMSFEVAMTDLGGNAIYLKGPIGGREPVKDMARVLSGYTQGIMARTFAHQTIIELSEYASVPVINALSDYSHPCQAMADFLTIQEHLGKLKGLTIAYVGDGNNVTRSLAFGCAKLGMKLTVASPKGYELDTASIEKAIAIRAGSIEQFNDVASAVKGADVIYTDTWVSMGQEDEKAKRVKDFEGFQVNSDVLKYSPDAKVMHCLPAYRGYEISDEVAESKNSVIFDQAENRLHFQRALLKKLLS